MDSNTKCDTSDLLSLKYPNKSKNFAAFQVALLKTQPHAYVNEGYTVSNGDEILPNYYKVKKHSEHLLSNSNLLASDLVRLVGNVKIQDAQKKISFIQDLVDEECWLACNCADKPKYLFPVQREKSFHFRQRNTSDVHNKDCFFNNLKSIKFEDSDIFTLPPKHNEIFDLCKKAGVTTPTESKGGVSSIARTVRLNKLGRLLLHAMTIANLNILSTTKSESVYQQMDNLVKSFEKIHYDKDHSVSNILFTSFNAFNETQSTLTKLEDKWASQKTEPHGFILTLINKISPTKNGYCIDYVHLDTEKNKKVEKSFTIYNSYFKSELKKINGYLSLESSGPWLGLFLIRKTKQYDNKPDSVSFLPVRGFLYPVHSSENLFPIESGKERQVLSKAISFLNYNKGKGNNCKIEKALYSQPNDDDQVQLHAIQPDFFIQSNSTCVLEVMGIINEDYTLRKKELEKYYKNKKTPFIELNATLNSEALNKEINDKVKNAFFKAIR